MYSAIASNKRKSWLLIAASVLLIGLVGWVIDRYAGFGGGLTFIAVAYSLISALIAYYAGDRMALWSAGAKPIEKDDAPELYRLVENLCIADGLPTPKIYLINDPVPNAFATGRDPQHASIAFTSGILERLEKTELEGVAAHELSHVKNYDIRVMMIIVVLTGAVTFMVNIFFRTRFRLGGRDRDNSGLVLLVLYLVVLIFAVVAANLIKLAVSRKREYLADASGALLTRYPDGLARALEKISATNRPLARANASTAHLYISNPFGQNPGWLAGLFSTHPPIQDRVKALREMAINPNA